MPSDRAWLSSLGPELARQREALAALLELSESADLVSSLSVGCSIGRGAADALSDVDAVLGVRTARGAAGAAELQAVEGSVIGLLPRIGTVVDVLRSETSGLVPFRRLFAQFADGLQLDLAVVAEEEVRRGEAAPDFVAVHWSGSRPATTNGPAAHRVTAEQVREWSFLGWRALLDADKYLQRGSSWEAHQRLHEARERIWALWAVARGAAYPWHGLSQVLDHVPDELPPGIEATVAGLDAESLRGAVVAAVDVLEQCCTSAGETCGSRVPTALAGYARQVLTGS